MIYELTGDDMMLCPAALVSMVTAAAAVIAEGRSADELALLGAVFTQLGDTITTISIQKGLIEQKRGNDHGVS